MSAYIQSPDHFNVLVSYFIDPRPHTGLWLEIEGQYTYMDQNNAHIVAQILYSENVRSVNGRYNETTSDEDYMFNYLRHAKDVYTVGEIALALDGLEYQSCENDDYHTTKGWTIICAMRKELLKKLQGDDLDTWSINQARPATSEYVSIMDMARRAK